jgi:acyl-CoA thioesterase-1
MVTHPIRIACFGDSLTEGYGLRPDEALPAILEQMLREDKIRATFLNHGVSGDTSGDGLARIDAVTRAKPDAVIVEFGANDFFVGEPIKNIKRNLTTIIETLLDKNIPILLVGITAIPDFGPEYKTEFDLLFKELADKYSLSLFPDILSCYLGDPMMMLMDKMHPNEHGVVAIAQGLLPQVKELAAAAKR